jgi:hypothetical protein
MARKLVTQLSNRECFTLTEKDTLKTASNKLQAHNVGVMPVLSVHVWFVAPEQMHAGMFR